MSDSAPIGTDPRTAVSTRAQVQRFPAPAGCKTVGGWEDGTIAAACDDGRWISHGPESADDWSEYTGPLLPVWEARAAKS